MANAVAAGWALSYVNRVGGRIHLSIHLPNYGDGATGDDARVKIVNGSRSTVTPATTTNRDGRVFLDATLPAGTYRNGLWELSISPHQGAPFKEAVARICIADSNPIALLVIPKTNSYVPAPRHTLPKRQRVAHLLGKVADRVLAELPPAQASKARAALRRTARRIIPS
jgi:hypothetical protein